MGSGASVSNFAAQQALDEKVTALLTLKWDRVHIRCNYALTEGGREIDPQITFSVVPGDFDDGKHPIVPSILEDKNSPATCTWLLEDRTHRPIWNETQLLLYLRSNVDSEQEVTRKLKVKLQDYRTLRDKIGEKVDNIKHGVGSGIRKMSHAIQKDDTKTFSPTMDHIEGQQDNKDTEEITSANAKSLNVVEEAGDLSETSSAKQGSSTPLEGTDAAIAHKPSDVLLDVDIDLPEPCEGWVQKKISNANATVYFSVRTSLAEDVLCKIDMVDQLEQSAVVTVLEPLSDRSKALLRYYQRPTGPATKAIFWIGGFNDTFHNPPAASAIWEAGFDLWVIDLRRCGACRKYLPEQDVNPLEYHHTDNFDEYIEEIDMALTKIRTEHDCSTIIGYGHSTGALALLNYLRFATGPLASSSKQHELAAPVVANKDALKGFIFNSPFLDCSVLGHDMAEKTKEFFQAKAMALGIVKNNAPVSKGGSVTVLNSWPFRLYSLWPFDHRVIALYELSITTGWKHAAKKIITAIDSADEHEPFTYLPFLVLSSRQDRYISEKKISRLSNNIGPMGTLIQIQHAEHDVLCSFDMEKCNECLGYFTAWLKSNFGTV